MRVSSSTYSACLYPEPLLRAVVLAAAVTAGLAGIAVITLLPPILLPLGVSFRWVAAVVWLAYSLLELWRLVRAYRIVASLAVAADRSVELVGRDGERIAARLQPSSLILPRLAWLRLKTDCGLRYGELLCGNSRKNKDWRRLQVIRRHVGVTN